ncbi:MAG: ABC transporter permease [Lentisphaeraceae bacterium]|nr:ABC transporter permease [Lentisphaeraceae bacterium]
MNGSAFIAIRSLKDNTLSTFITSISIALACGLMMAVYAFKEQARDAFIMKDLGYDAVVGAKGSQLQLVLNSIYHMDQSPGNISWEIYQSLKQNRMVKNAIPMAVGDNYYGYRIVGTNKDLFTHEKNGMALSKGKYFDKTKNQALVGSVVAETTGLKIGDKFKPYHGLTFNPEETHENEFEIVGILENTNTPNDKVIWIPIDSFFKMDGHVLRGAGENFEAEKSVEIPDEHKEVSAVLVEFRSPFIAQRMAAQINRGDKATAAYPVATVMLDLFDKVGWVHKVLEMVTWLIMIVAAATVLVSIYSTMHDRRREFAILRSLGAPRSTLVNIILSQAFLLSLLGVIGGFVFYSAILSIAGQIIRAQTGILLETFKYSHALWLGPVAMILLSLFVAMIPALKAYKTDVAENLKPTS